MELRLVLIGTVNTPGVPALRGEAPPANNNIDWIVIRVDRTDICDEAAT